MIWVTHRHQAAEGLQDQRKLTAPQRTDREDCPGQLWSTGADALILQMSEAVNGMVG